MLLLLLSLVSRSGERCCKVSAPSLRCRFAAQSKMLRKSSERGRSRGVFWTSFLEVFKVSEATNLDNSQFHFSCRHWTVWREGGKKKRRKINTPNPGHLSEIGCVGRAFSLQIRAVVRDRELDPAPGSSSVELIQAQGKIQCARSKWKHSSLDFWIDSLNSESGNATGTPSTAPGRSILAPNTSRNRENFVGQTP